MAKKTTTKTAPKKTTAAKKAAPKKKTTTKKAAAPNKAAPADTGGFTKAQARALVALKGTKSGKGMSRADLEAKTGVAKGWSRVLGAGTKDDGGVAGDKTLSAQGYVGIQKLEGEPLSYYLTAKGTKAAASLK